MKKNILINAVLVLALLTLAAITSLSYWQMNQLAIHEQADDFTFTIIQNLDSLLNDLREVRTGQRGYFRSGEERYLKSYRDASKKVEGDLESLAMLTREQPDLKKRLDAIENLVRRRLSVLEERIDGKDRGTTTAGEGTGREDMAALRNQVAAAKGEAVNLKRAVSARQDADFRRMERLTVVNSIFTFCLFSMVFLLLRRDIARRIESEQELISHRDELEEQVKTRTADLVEANRALTSEIMERERFEEALQLNEKKYRSLFENSLDAVILAVPDGKIVSANRAACEMFRMTEDELIRVGRAGIVDPADGRLAAALEERARSGRMSCELNFLRKDGSKLTGEVSSIMLDDGMTSFVIIHDITERKWAEQVKRNLGEYEYAIQEQERLAISREVHDEIGQNLTALKLDLSWIERRFPPDSVEMAGRLQEMRANLDQLIAKAQRITAELRPPLLDNLGLSAAIEWQAREFERRSGIECQSMLNEAIEVSDEHAATTIIRIFQEALSNITRHAGATEVSVSLCERDDRIILEVADNGRGITSQEMNSSTAYGIMGMRERASLCSGELSISGAPGEGTIVRLSMPRNGATC